MMKQKIISPETVKFEDNPSIKNTRDTYLDIHVDVEKILESWQLSIFSFEWINPDGDVKSLEELNVNERQKRLKIESVIKSDKPVFKAILGIGIQDNIEIGSGRAEFLTLAAHNFKTLPIHIRKSQEKDFKSFMADVNS